MYEGIHRLLDESYVSGDSWMYPYHRTPMGNPYISPREHSKYHGYTARGTPNCPLNVEMELLRNRSNHPSLAQHKVEPAKVRVSWSLETFLGGSRIFLCWSSWVVPPPSKSHHQDYYIFSRESQPKPSFPLLLGGGTTQYIHIENEIYLYNPALGWNLLEWGGQFLKPNSLKALL